MHTVAIHGLLVLGLSLLTAGSASAQDDDAPPAMPPVSTSPVQVPIPAVRVRPVPIDRAAPVGAPDAPENRDVPGDRWKVGADFSYTDQSGNKAIRLLTAGLKLSHRQKEAFELDGTLQSRYGQSDSEVVTRNYFGSLNFSSRPNAVVAPSLSLKAERDPFKRLDLRFSGGAGAKVTPYQRAKSSDELSISLQLAYEFTNLQPVETAAEPELQHRPRWAMEVRGSQVLQPGITGQHQSSFEPAWGELANYLLRSQTGMKILVTRQLALLVEYQVNQNNRPPDGVAPTDRLFKTGISIEL